MVWLGQRGEVKRKRRGRRTLGEGTGWEERKGTEWTVAGLSTWTRTWKRTSEGLVGPEERGVVIDTLR